MNSWLKTAPTADKFLGGTILIKRYIYMENGQCSKLGLKTLKNNKNLRIEGAIRYIGPIHIVSTYFQHKAVCQVLSK